MNRKKELQSYLRKRILRWGKENYLDFPWRITKNPWHALVAEIMLQRTKAEQVAPAFSAFCKKYQTPLQYFKDPYPNTFKTLGLPQREKELKDLAVQLLILRRVPSDKSSLLALPAVGDYIASAFRSFHVGLRDVIVDSNVVRLYGRFFGFDFNGETRRKKWLIALANAMTPLRHFRTFNYALLDFTRQICKQKPLCEICCLRKRCSFFRKTLRSGKNREPNVTAHNPE